MAAATAGDVGYLENVDLEQLCSWSSTRRRTATHISAAHSHVHATVVILGRVELVHLNMCDIDGRTPLSVAAEAGALAGVEALINLKADSEIPSNSGLTALHYAAEAGDAMITKTLNYSISSWRSQEQWRARSGYQALHVAAYMG